MFKIAICDDDCKYRSIISDYVKNVLSDKEIAITEFDSGIALLENDKAFDIVFLDVELHGISGIEVAKRMNYTSVILISGYPEVVHLDWPNYAKAYIEKPITLYEFAGVVAKVYEEREAVKMSIENVRKHLEKYDLQDKILQFNESSATVELAAKALDCEECRIAKTLSFYGNDEVILVVVAGDAKIDNKKYKTTFGLKAKMLAYEDVEPMTGHKVGGVCPFAVNEGVKVYLDESLKRFDTVFPACGTANSAIELTIEELTKCSEALDFVDVCKL